MIQIENNAINDIFTLREEQDSTKRDHYDRFLKKYSKRNNIEKPVVTKYLLDNKIISKPKWPDGKSFAICLTHDIDSIYLDYKRALLSIGKGITKMKFNNFFQRLYGIFFKRKNLYYNFQQIINLEKKYDAKSTFFFLCADDEDKRYEVQELKDIIVEIKKQGFEIGLHGSMDSYKNPKMLKQEKDKLENIIQSEVIGIREHYLRFDIQETWLNQVKAGFKYDTTLGYVDHIGFRNGMCYPFHPIDPSKNEAMKIVEIPLTVMDVTLWKYMNLDFKKAWENVKKLLNRVKDTGGVITILWHNDQFDNIFWPRSAELYEKILQFGKENNAWMTSGEEIFRSYKI